MVLQYHEGSSLPNTINQKDEKLYTAGLDDTAILHINIKLPTYRLKTSSIPQYRESPCPPHLDSGLVNKHQHYY